MLSNKYIKNKTIKIWGATRGLAGPASCPRLLWILELEFLFFFRENFFIYLLKSTSREHQKYIKRYGNVPHNYNSNELELAM
jgi:hypothetical protein